MTRTGFVEAPGGRLYHEVDGSGPVVILVHAGVANLRMWDPHVAALAADHNVVRYDTRGYGRTESEHVEFSNRADLIAVMDHAGADRACLVGVSRGGQIVLDTALEHPDRVSGLVVGAGGVSGFQPTTPVADSKMWEEAERMWLAHEWEGLSEFETRLWVDGPGQPSDRVDPQIRSLVHGWILDNYRAEKEAGIPQPLDPPAAGRLGEVRCPTLVATASLDDPGTIQACRFLADGVAGARVEVVEGAAHMFNLEQPERFTRLVREFLGSLR
ncbi:MAG: alpha/beta fold hydrolase [Actinomycetota bacterium]